MEAGCEKRLQGYELHWKKGCMSDPHIVKKEDQFQEQSVSEESLFSHHIIEAYSKLLGPSHL